MLRSAWLLGALATCIGCASPGKGTHPSDGGFVLHDLHVTGDAHPSDLAMKKPGDGATVVDQAMNGADDLAMQAAPDMAVQPMPDMAMGNNMCVPQTQPCDVICQNCGVNLKCSVGQNGQPVCIANGNVGLGGACGNNGVDDCQAGDVCVTESMNLNLCIGFCRVDADCKNGGKCAYTLNGGNLKVCSDKVTNCDPVNQTGCNQGACYVVTPDGQTGCHAAGAGQDCDNCVTDYDCSPGYACITGTNHCNGATGCVPLCHAGNDGDCFSFFLTTCGGVGGWNNYGVCDF
jgi:hypothetical protein